jgi:exosortase
VSSPSAADQPAAGQPVPLVTREALTRCLKLLAPIVLVVIACLPALTNLIENAWSQGRDRSYSQGWLVVPICLWLLYRTGADLPALRLRTDAVMTVAAFVLGVGVFVASRTNVVLLELLLVPLLMVAGIAALYGRSVARRCVFAIGFFYFAIPIWDVLNGVLQWGTVIANRALIRIFSIPASFEATSIHLPSGTITIEGGCSGLHFFVVGVTLGTLHAYLSGKSLWRTVSLAAAMAIAANWLRVFIIVAAGYLTNMQHYLVRVDHYKFGWAVFAVMLVFFFWIVSRFRSHATPVANAVPERATSESTASPLAVALAAGAIVLGPVTSRALDLRSPAGEFRELATPAGWTLAGTQPARWAPRFESADRATLQSWRNGMTEIDSFHAQYGTETLDKKLAGFGNTVFGDEIFPDEVAPADLAGWREAIVANGSARSIFWFTYYVGERRYPSALRAQLQYGASSLAHPVMSGVIAFRAACAADCAPERALVKEFASAASP